MVEIIVLALLAAKLRKYDIKPLFKHWSVYPMLACSAFYIFAQAMIFSGNHSIIKYSRPFETMFILSCLPLMYRYKQYVVFIIGSASAVAGTFLNKAVIAANGGKMPVFPSLSYITGYVKPGVFESTAQAGDFHILGSSTTRLAFLSDVFDVGYSIMSIGDLLIRLLIFLIVFASAKQAHINSRAVSADCGNTVSPEQDR